jgi:4-alpha-glucanotransferase
MSALDRLAVRMGIEGQFQNAAGEIQRTSGETKRRLLGAMGADVRGEAEARAELAAREREDWSRPLPPVLVARESERRIAVPITLPAGAGALTWSLREESGAVRQGTLPFGNFEPIDDYRLDGLAMERRHLVIEAPSAIGYHQLHVETSEGASADMALIFAPQSCHVPDGLADDRPIWGISAQLYLLRSDRNWGIGDFTDLKSLVEIAADLRASIIGLNPLHTMFLDRPEHASPYSPASRLFLNVLYIDVTALPEWSGSDRPPPEVSACRETARVDYEAVARLKLPVLERLFRRFVDGADRHRRAAFGAFRQQRGEALQRLCHYKALREYFAAKDQGADWRHWPEDYRDPGSSAVTRFAETNRERIDFFAWMQWVADEQLAAAAETARSRRMAVGLYRDLAVGADMGGAETWSSPGVVVSSAHVGAPPDLHNPAGQDWGLPPFNPQALRREAYAGFIDLVRANMRHAGGLRIDHVMAIQHLYWIPEGRPPSEGAYVSYPLDDLTGILALESQRHRCVVVGEDLGTVPEGFRERMEAAGILSYRVLAFEQQDGHFIPPAKYPALALAAAGSHDLATLRGWWEERDIDLKERHGLYSGEAEAKRQREQRVSDRAALVEALQDAGLRLPDGFDACSGYRLELNDAVHEFLARTRAGIAMVQLDDLTDEFDQVNLPATTDEHPNWRRKQSLSLEEIAASRRIRVIADMLNRARANR